MPAAPSLGDVHYVHAKCGFASGAQRRFVRCKRVGSPKPSMNSRKPWPIRISNAMLPACARDVHDARVPVWPQLRGFHERLSAHYQNPDTLDRLSPASGVEAPRGHTMVRGHFLGRRLTISSRSSKWHGQVQPARHSLHRGK